MRLFGKSIGTPPWTSVYTHLPFYMFRVLNSRSTWPGKQLIKILVAGALIKTPKFTVKLGEYTKFGRN